MSPVRFKIPAISLSGTRWTGEFGFGRCRAGIIPWPTRWPMIVACTRPWWRGIAIALFRIPRERLAGGLRSLPHGDPLPVRRFRLLRKLHVLTHVPLSFCCSVPGDPLVKIPVRLSNAAECRLRRSVQSLRAEVRRADAIRHVDQHREAPVLLHDAVCERDT